MSNMYWRNIERTLPKEDERVIVYRPEMDEMAVSIVWGWTCINKAKGKGITHWMPIPDKPGIDIHCTVDFGDGNTIETINGEIV